MERETAMKILKELHNKSLFAERTALETIIPELKESEDEKIRKALVRFHKSTIDIDGIKGADILAWLEKQCYTKKDVDDAYLKGIIDAKNELEKQGEQKPIDYNKELKKCRENPLYFFDKYVKLEKQKPACSEEDERVKKRILLSLEKDLMAIKNSGCDTQDLEQCIAWLEKQGEKKPTEVRTTGYWNVKDIEQKPFDYEHTTITQKDFASVGETATIELSSPIDCGDRIYHVSHKPIEKQGEQKTAVTDFNAKDWYVSKVDGKIHDMTYNPTDKVEPKFKVGDWINGYYTNYKITAISNKEYVVEDTDGNKMNILFENEKFHNLWTIQDAKEGDVVVDKSDGTIGIFQSMGHHPDGGSFNDPSYCFLHCRYDDGYFFADFEDGNMMTSDDVIPATKEQRDLLFTKMKEAGYEWDAEKKELKKLTQSVTKKSDQDARNDEDEIEIPFGAKDSELIEERYYISEGCYVEVRDGYVTIKKDEKPTAWSDEDESIVSSIEGALEGYEGMVNEDWKKEKEWLKSFKDKVTWKPSKEQMEALKYYMHTLLATEHKEVLFGLYNDLKKL